MIADLCGILPVKKIGNTAIPDNYHGIFWDVEVLKKDNADKVAILSPALSKVFII